MSWKSRLRRRVFALALTLFVGCGTHDATESDSASALQSDGRESGTAGVAPDQTDATWRMVQVLDSLHQKTLSEPLAYYYMNLEHASLIREKAGSDAGEMPDAARRAYASALLNGGETEQAIRQIEILLDDLERPSARPTRDQRELIELLAVAYLRLGEQQNCIARPGSSSCILPIQDSAIHTLRSGSLRAVDLYKQILNRHRGDYSSRWLLNIAAMTLGSYPDSLPPDLLIPGLDADSSSAIPHFANVAGALGVDFNDLAGGVAVDDFNNDDFLDIFTTAHRLNDASRLFLNDGTGGFVDRSTEAGLTGISGGLNILHADYDNDGHNDVLILRGGWLGDSGRHPNSLLKNNGDGTFDDVTEEAGLLSYHPTQTGAWSDFNNDGWLDLFIGNEESDRWLQAWQSAGAAVDADTGRNPSELYMNNGDGTFTEVASQFGIRVEAFVKGAAWGDVNNDGLPDLYLSIIGSPNRLYLNRGANDASGWLFEEVSAGVHEPFFSFAAWFFDFDNDGWQDLFVAPYDLRRINEAAGDVAREYLGLPVNTEMPRLFRNNGDGTFTNVAETMGLDRVLFAMGANYGDLDNDGYLDVYVGTGAPDLRAVVPNRMFLNAGGRRFDEVTLQGGFGHIQKGHAVAFADFDEDGDQDIYASMGGVYGGDGYGNVLFENPGADAEASWITLRLEGRRSNRSSIGARISISITDRNGGERLIHRTVSTGGSFGSSSLQLEIGLGRTDRIDELQIIWPNSDRTVERFFDLPVNRFYKVVEGLGKIDVIPGQAVPFRRDDVRPHSHH